MAAGVGIVTTGAKGERRGLTATAICSLSDDPPTVLACVNVRAAAHDFIIQHGAFAINALASDQKELARCFSGQLGLSGEDRFVMGDWRILQTGAPILGSALFSLDCELVDHKAVATHTIFIGRVVAAGHQPSSPLVYHQGAYKLLTATV
jgi:flavin reductase (DIM6/NTAB) family NADH-FMN oxidoreductase RutF